MRIPAPIHRFVPSHFGRGTKRDFLDFWEMFRKLDEVSGEANAEVRPAGREAYRSVRARVR